MSCGQKPIHHQTVARLDRHRQLCWIAVSAQPSQRRVDPFLAVGKRPPIPAASFIRQQRHVM